MGIEQFLNPVDQGEYLNFRVPFEGNTIPVSISREALEDHFSAAELGGLLPAYVAAAKAIDAKAQSKAQPGVAYTIAQPLRLATTDF